MSPLLVRPSGATNERCMPPLPLRLAMDGRSPWSSWLGPFRSGCACFALLLAAARALAAEEPLQVFYNERPPYMVQDAEGRVTGLTADPTAYALKKAGVVHTWVAMPSARQLLKIQENRARLAAIGWYKNAEREKFAKFSEPIYQDRQIAVLARLDNRRVAEARSVEELLSIPGLTLLRKYGYSYGRELDERIARRSPATVQVTVENLNMIQMLHARRADWMFIAPEEASSAIRLAGVPASEVQTRTFPDMPPGEKRYLLFSAQVDDETIRRINRYLSEYRTTRK